MPVNRFVLNVFLVIGSVAAAAAQSPAPKVMTATTIINGATNDLSNIVWVAAARDGTILVGETTLSQILYFSPAGKLIGRFGRNGAGPGEFGRLSTFGWLGDTLWVDDLTLRRTTFITPQRKLLRTVVWPVSLSGPLSKAHTAPMTIVSPPLAFDESGDYVMSVFRIVGESSTPVPVLYSTTLLRASKDGRVKTALGAAEKNCPGSLRAEVAPRALLCGGSPVGLSRDGRLFATFGGGTTTSPASSAVRVTLGSTVGSLLFDRTLTMPALPIPQRVRDSILLRYRDRKDFFTKEDLGALMAKTITKGIPLSPALGIRVTDDSTVWLELPTLQGELWQLLDAQGREISRLIPPPRVNLRHFTRSSALGTLKDDDGIPSIVRLTWK